MEKINSYSYQFFQYHIDILLTTIIRNFFNFVISLNPSFSKVFITFYCFADKQCSFLKYFFRFLDTHSINLSYFLFRIWTSHNMGKTLHLVSMALHICCIAQANLRFTIYSISYSVPHYSPPSDIDFCSYCTKLLTQWLAYSIPLCYTISNVD